MLLSLFRYFLLIIVGRTAKDVCYPLLDVVALCGMCDLFSLPEIRMAQSFVSGSTASHAMLFNSV